MQEVNDLCNGCNGPGENIKQIQRRDRLKVGKYSVDPYNTAYTGTHDNETIAGWWKSIMAKERKLARDYLCDNYTPDKELHKCFISLVMRSSAKLCVIPMQDYMGLDNSCRMNQPSTVGKNWKWRVNSRQLSLKLQKEIQEMTLRYGRMNWETVE